MSDQPASGSVEASGDIKARDIITGIQQNFTVIFGQAFEPPPDLARLRADYLTCLRDGYRYLDMKGLMQVQQVTQQLPLAAVYVPLKAYGQRPASESLRRVAGRTWPEMAGEGPAELAALAGQAEARPIDELLKTAPAVVILGDPGAGKSTLLKMMALALAEQPGGPLPILLPLNGYARRLAQGEINLSGYLAEYYAGRQVRLKGVQALFEQALAQKQAVILLDGLDEVQANRSHLVRLIQDFAAEYIPEPGETDQPTPGNRLLVTSRLVGYEEAPLAGRRWRSYTLIDFDRADIETFIRQWTLAFAVSVQGNTEAARQAAEQERRDLLTAIEARPSVERLAANPLLLTILALIKYTGVTLPEERVKLYELYLQALIESWNRARSLDQYPVGPGLKYEETVQILAPLALWLRRVNPTAGLVSRDQLEAWLTDHFAGEDWGLPRGEAYRRGQDFLVGVNRYTNLLLERGERQYGFLHLTLEEMLAAKGIAHLTDRDPQMLYLIFRDYLLDAPWRETLQLAVGVIGVLQQRPHSAGLLLQQILAMALPPTAAGHQVIFAGEALLDVGRANISRPAADRVTEALVETMQSSACPLRVRREAGDLLGRLGWRPQPDEGDFLLAPADSEPTGLDTFRVVPNQRVLMGKYPVTNYQFVRFIKAGGYDNPAVWSETGWAWRTGRYDSRAPKELQDWLESRPAALRHQPFWWADRQWNSPLYPVVGLSWFEAEAYGRWLSQNQGHLYRQRNGQLASMPVKGQNVEHHIEVRLPQEAEWEAAMGGRGEYPWGEAFDPVRLNCADSWAGRDLSDYNEWQKWFDSDSRREAGLTAVATFPTGVSQAGVWDGAGNVWEWMGNAYSAGRIEMPLRGGAWLVGRRNARVSARDSLRPVSFLIFLGMRVVVAPIISSTGGS